MNDTGRKTVLSHDDGTDFLFYLIFKDREEKMNMTQKTEWLTRILLSAVVLLIFSNRGLAQKVEFKGEPTSGYATLQVVFTDLSTGWGPNTTREWEFPGGNPEADTGPSPTVDYAAAGSYTVVLKVMSGGQELDRETKTSYIYVLQPWDFGDAPDPTYPTKQTSNGARHLIDPKVFLGLGVDPESEGQSHDEAVGDDQDGNDDEEGVEFQTQLIQGDTATAEVTASVSGMLKAWMDFNQDGDWDDPGELICDTQVIPGSNIIQIIVPLEAAIGNTFTRFRFSTAEIPSFDGPSYDGEVEDYMVFVMERPIFPYEFGDAPEGVLAYFGQWIEFSTDDVIGEFTTCGPYGRVRHGTLGQRYFGGSVDYETEGNAGNCAADLFNMDETARPDGDAGLRKAWSFQIKKHNAGPGFVDFYYIDFFRFRAPLFVNPCSHPLFTCEVGEWGDHMDMEYHVTAPEGAYVNVLVDWNLNGRWCDGGMIFHCDDGGIPHLHEHILRDFYVPPGEGLLSDLDPPDFRIGATPGYVWARFTISDTPVAIDDWIGHADFADGETEDYMLWVADPGSYDMHRDWGDAPDGNLAYPSLGVTGHFPTCGPLHTGTVNHGNETGYFNVYLGKLTSQPSVEPSGNRGYCGSVWNLDDDFALQILTPYTIEGPPGAETIFEEWFSSLHTQTSLGGVCQMARWGRNLDIETINWLYTVQDAYLNVLIDWNQDGYWGGSVSCDDAFGNADEHVLKNFRLDGSAVSYSSLTELGDPPDFRIGPNPGYVWARFTITPVEVELPWDGSGSFNDGETEDYLLKVEDFGSYDYGDLMWPGFKTLTVDDGARHLIETGFFMGDTVDADPDGQPDPDAAGDDKHGVDDEDGVHFPSALTPGEQATIEVEVSADGILSAWMDFNADTSWDDQGEQILNDNQVTAGKNVLNITIPADAVPGIIFARFRFSDVGGLSYFGPSRFADQGGIIQTPPIGEVEDYQIIIGGENYEFGDAPEGALAYPSLGVMGKFPTCKAVGPAGFVQHGTRGWTFFGYSVDFETGGNGGFCPTFTPDGYDRDESSGDSDCGLVADIYTIQGSVGSEVVVPVLTGEDGFLGYPCQTAEWGTDINLWWDTGIPEGAYVNMLIDWNQDGRWGGSISCGGAPEVVAIEHVLQDFHVPGGTNGYLGVLSPPSFLIGPKSGYVWVRMTISESPVGESWDGSGVFIDGETEDHLIRIESGTGVEEESEMTSSRFMLLDNFPNPFNPDTKIQYRLPTSAHVRLKIFNMAGQELRVLVDEQKSAGFHSIRWDARDDGGRHVEAGVYLYRIEAGSYVDTKKLLLVK